MGFFRIAGKTTGVTFNVIVCVLFLLSCYGGALQDGSSWLLGLITLSSFYLLLLVFIFLLIWGFTGNWLLMLISLIAILLGFRPFQHIVPVRTAVTMPESKQTGAIRVMSWNVELFRINEHKTHPELKTKMLNLIRSTNPDVICIQEAVVGGKASINDLDDIQASLNMPYRHYSYLKRMDYDQNHHFGILIFSRYPIIQKEAVIVENHYNGVFQYADLQIGPKKVRVFNLHLQSMKFNNDMRKYLDDPSLSGHENISKSKSVLYMFRKSYPKRKKQSDAIREAIAKSPYPVIVCGDFNDGPNSYAYATIGRGLINTFHARGSGLGSTYHGISPTLRIDNIFVSPSFLVDYYKKIDSGLSDHYPIVTDIRLP
ncbi:MAG: endonuclease/exonuclease/phosphatase family protein [Ferruginibacter sp.]